MLDFGKLFAAVFFINLSMIVMNFTGVFPEEWSPDTFGIESAYNDVVEQLQWFQSTDMFNVIQFAGAMIFITLFALKLILLVFLTGPIYIGATFSTILGSFGVLGQIAYIFTLITYLAFIYWIIDVIRNRWVSLP